jgi:hypothetical protein
MNAVAAKAANLLTLLTVRKADVVACGVSKPDRR